MGTRQKRLLGVLHCSPPAHGAARVGDFIRDSQNIHAEFDCEFIPIRSSETIGDIGQFSLRKIGLAIALWAKVASSLLRHRPDVIYYTASVETVALLRDVFIALLFKSYGLFTDVQIYFHYHTRGVKGYMSSAAWKGALTRFLLRGSGVVALSESLEGEFQGLDAVRRISFLPNGVEDPFEKKSFDGFVRAKFALPVRAKKVLYLSNMIKSKGYFEVLELALEPQFQTLEFHFAGGWQSHSDEQEFHQFIKQHHLESRVFFHGFVNGKEKRKLFEDADVFAFPTRYPKEAFPLSILEALSYGVPVLATREASIPSMVPSSCGVLIEREQGLRTSLVSLMDDYVNEVVARKCRDHYLENFTLERFEENFIAIMAEHEQVASPATFLNERSR